MVDALLAWVFGLNPLIVWIGGGLVAWVIYLVAEAQTLKIVPSITCFQAIVVYSIAIKKDRSL